MKKILLINGGEIPHYRVPVYNYLSDYLRKKHFSLTIVSDGMQKGTIHPIRFDNRETHLVIINLMRLIISNKPDIIIFWVKPGLNMWTVLYLAKLINIKVIHWGHRRPDPPNVYIKTFLCNILEHWPDDAIILYAQHLREYVWKRFQSKTFVANNTLDMMSYNPLRRPKEEIKSKYGISTNKNIVCVGRMQTRKRIGDLIKAFRALNMEDVGLILVGPDSEGILINIEDKNIFKLGPIYGEESLDLLSASDVYCLPGAIGLSIVDAFYCGLPVVTENVRHGPEITYLKDGINGFIVPKGDIDELVKKLKMLLKDDFMRDKFSQAARSEIMTNGHIERMCEGFLGALQYVCE